MDKKILWLYNEVIYEKDKAKRIVECLNNKLDKNGYITVDEVKKEYCKAVYDYAETAKIEFLKRQNFDDIGAGFIKGEDSSLRFEYYEIAFDGYEAWLIAFSKGDK